ncbi:MAG: ABC transporter permease [Ruminiclostridium sp.]|nr:ABC transporter permease [Ruminiclostridium sp.]
MVRGSLFKKSIRDMRNAKAQFISIFIMAALSVTIVTGLDSVWKTIEDNSDIMYAATNISDMWVYVTNPTEKQMWSVSRLQGVERAEKRFTLNAICDLADRPTLKVYAVSSQSVLDRSILHQGNLKSKSGAILDEEFAKEHGLGIDDKIKLKLNGKWTSFNIEGLALSSEHIYSIKGTTSIMPDSRKYGFIIIHEDMLKGIYGIKIYNQLCVRLSPGAEVSDVKNEIGRIFGDDLVGTIAIGEDSSTNNIYANINQFRTLATVFPLMFFLVTALITQSTMFRMVENQRPQIGILKALGYSKARILWHYTSYGVYMGGLGALTGFLIGPTFFTRLLIPWLQLNLSSNQISINYVNLIFSLLLILACTGGVSLYAGLKLLKDKPALLLRDKPPKKGSHIFLEYLPWLWNRMRFSRKLIARNTLKNKMRLLMSVLGITGCTGLVVAAFTLSSMVDGIAGYTYNVTYSYDHKIILDKKADSRYIHNKRIDGTVAQIKETSVEIIRPGGKRTMEQLTIFPQHSPLIHLQDVDGITALLAADGLTITRKLSQTLGVKAGDIIELKSTDKGYIKVPIRQIIYMASGQGMYMTDEYYESIGETFKPSAILVKWNQQPDEAFLAGDYVDEYVDRETQIEDTRGTTQVVYIAAVLLIIMGAILAFVVLYNSSILNFSERIRDLATLKVLGFYPNEISALVLTENILSVVLGSIFGMPLGKFIAQVAASGLNDQLDLLSRITLTTAVLSGAITFIFALINNGIVARKMKDLDMLDSLKSVE